MSKYKLGFNLRHRKFYEFQGMMVAPGWWRQQRLRNVGNNMFICWAFSRKGHRPRTSPYLFFHAYNVLLSRLHQLELCWWFGMITLTPFSMYAFLSLHRFIWLGYILNNPTYEPSNSFIYRFSIVYFDKSYRMTKTNNETSVR